METSKLSIGETLFDLTLYVADTPANRLATQASAEERTTRDTCGLGLEMPLANYDQNTQSWKMYGDTYLWGDSPLLENLPVSGMTQNGVLFLQPVWVPITGVIESSLWPTPTTQEVEHPQAELTETGRRKSKNGNTSHSLGLADAVQIWPTPVASDAWTGDMKSTQQTEGSRHSLNLSTAVQKWPTPTYGKLAGGSGGFNQIEELYLTGQVTLEEKKAMQAGNGGRLNPTWVEWLMGFPTGWTDLED
jgi:DNA (cytosine-5)-methyltransferase 1